MKYDITWSLLIIIFSGNRLAQLPEAYRVYPAHVPVSKGGASWPARLTDISSSSPPLVIIIVIFIDSLKNQQSSNLGYFCASHSFRWYVVYKPPLLDVRLYYNLVYLNESYQWMSEYISVILFSTFFFVFLCVRQCLSIKQPYSKLLYHFAATKSLFSCFLVKLFNQGAVH